MTELNWLDRAIGYVAPRTALRRVHARSVLQGVAVQRRRYEAARSGRVIGSRADATGEVLAAGAALREAARDLVRNNSFAAKALDSWAAHAAPIAARAQIPGVQRRQAKRLHDPIDTLWWEWAQRAAAEGDGTFDALQAAGVRALIRDGGYIIRRRDRPASFKLPIPFQLQFLELDYLDGNQDRSLDNGDVIVGGIQFDKRKRRRGYWLHTEHPGASRVFTRLAPRSVFVPADEVAHVFESHRFDQVTGASWFAPAIVKIKDLDEYDEAELVRKKIEACFVAFVSGDADSMGETLGPSGTDESGNRVESFEPGMITYSDTPRQVTFGEPKAVGGYPDYVRVQHRACAAALGLTYELWTGDLSQVNFSSARMGLLQFRARVKQVQDTVLIPRSCQPVWNWFVEYAQGLGLAPQGTIWARWSPPEWESVQPLDDATTEALRLRNGTLTGPEALSRRGYDWLETLDEHEQWYSELDRRGLVFDSDPRQVSKAGLLQPQVAEPAPAQPNEPPEDANDPEADDEAPDEAGARRRSNGHALNGNSDVLRLAQNLIARRNAEERPH